MGCSFCRQKRLILFCFSAKGAVKDGLLACERPSSGTGKAVFSADGRQVEETAPLVVTGDSFDRYLEEGPVLFIGDGAEKCRGTITSPNASFCQCCPKASAMLLPAIREYKEKRFKDTAYFEPFYLKEFVATSSSKKLF